MKIKRNITEEKTKELILTFEVEDVVDSCQALLLVKFMIDNPHAFNNEGGIITELQNKLIVESSAIEKN